MTAMLYHFCRILSGEADYIKPDTDEAGIFDGDEFLGLMDLVNFCRLNY
jgi:hypothetical protein